MTPAIMADHNIEGHLRALLAIWQSDPWGEIWAQAEIAVESFASLGIMPDVSDSELWEACQAHGVVLLTANRNDKDPDSLEATIRHRNTEASLPVLTLANPDRFSHDREYAVEVAVRVLERLLDIENYRGAGRIFV